MGAEAQAVQAPAKASTPPATETKPAPPKTPREVAVEIVNRAKAESAAADAKPAEPAKAEPAKTEQKTETTPETKKPEEEVKPSREIAIIARENRKILAMKEDLKKEKASLDARTAELDAKIKAAETDLKLLERIKAKDFTALEEVDKEWYPQATKQVVAKQKPEGTEALALRLEKQLGDITAQIAELKSPKKEEEKPKDQEPTFDPELAKKHVAEYTASVAELVKSMDGFKVEVDGKPLDPDQVAKDAVDHVDALIRRKQAAAIKLGKKYELTSEEINGLVLDTLNDAQKKIAESKRKELTPNSDTSTVDGATTVTSGESGAAKPQQITPRQKPTTEVLHDSVSVSAGPQTFEQRRQAAIDLVRRAKQDAGE